MPACLLRRLQNLFKIYSPKRKKIRRFRARERHLMLLSFLSRHFSSLETFSHSARCSIYFISCAAVYKINNRFEPLFSLWRHTHIVQSLSWCQRRCVGEKKKKNRRDLRENLPRQLRDYYECNLRNLLNEISFCHCRQRCELPMIIWAANVAHMKNRSGKSHE